MSRYPITDDTTKLIQECDSILSLCKSRGDGGSVANPGNETWPWIELNEIDITKIVTKLEKAGEIIVKISEFSKSISEPFITISQRLIGEHADTLHFLLAIEQKSIHSSDQGKIIPLVNAIKHRLLEYERHYKVTKSYNLDKQTPDYEKFSTKYSKKPIDWSKRGTVLTLIFGIVGVASFFIALFTLF